MWDNHVDYCTDKMYRIAQDSWVRHYKNKLESRAWYELAYSSHTRKVLIEKFYHEGRMLGRLHLMDFQQFEFRMNNPERYRYYWRSVVKGHSFRQKDYKPKILSKHEQAKREWREFKMMGKDKAKPYWKLGRKSYWTRMGRKCERRFVRQELSKGNYDFPMDDRVFVNPWDWD